MDPVRLQASTTSAVVSPHHGGSILSFSVAGTQVLRAGADSPDPRTLASFPLVPYCNRVADGVLHWEGDTIEMGPSIPDEPHALHGHGWLGRWQTEEQGSNWVRLGYTHPAGSWPWRYRAEQTVTVEPGRLTVTLGLVNLATKSMPAGIGFHPYFSRPARITATLDGLWRGEDTLPDRWEEHPGFRAQDVDAIAFDNTFTGWDGRAVVESPEGRIEISSNLAMLHVYVPPGRGMFCLEPVTAAPDALNHPERGAVALAPGETLSGEMTVTLGG